MTAGLLQQRPRENDSTAPQLLAGRESPLALRILAKAKAPLGTVSGVQVHGPSRNILHPTYLSSVYQSPRGDPGQLSLGFDSSPAPFWGGH